MAQIGSPSAIGFYVAFALLFCISALYSVSDKFNLAPRLRCFLVPMQVGSAIILLISAVNLFFRTPIRSEYIDCIFLASFFILVSHAIRDHFFPKRVAMKNGHSDLFNTKLAFLSNFAMFFGLMLFTMIADNAIDSKVNKYLMCIVFIISALMILKESYYLLRYTKPHGDRKLSFVQILFGEIFKSSSVIFVFSMFFLLSLDRMLKYSSFSAPDSAPAMAATDFGALAFCSLIGASCPDQWQWESMVWATNFLAAVGYYVLGIALTAAISKIE